MCEVLDQIEARGIRHGEIKGFVLLYSEEMHLMPEDIVRKIMQRFSLDSNTAEKYVEETLGLQIV